MPFTPAELAAEHARAMRIVKAVLAACDARAATARAGREHNLKPGDAPWVLAIGKAAIGMAEGIKDVCGEPNRHLIITVDGPPALSLTNILRSDHPLPTQRSLDAGQAVKRFIEEANAAGAPALTVLISGGASSLICEPIPGIDLDEYRAVVQAMLQAGWSIQRMNTVRRAIDELKGGSLAALAVPIAIDLLVISDVIGDTFYDIGSGPFVTSPTTNRNAEGLLSDVSLVSTFEGVAKAVQRRPEHPAIKDCRRAIVAASNATAAAGALAAIESEGFTVASVHTNLTGRADAVAWKAKKAIELLHPREALTWSGEWPARVRRPGYGGRAQTCIAQLHDYCESFRNESAHRTVALAIATDGADGSAPSGTQTAAGAWCWSGMTWNPDPSSDLISQWPDLQLALQEPDEGFRYFNLQDWREANSFVLLAHRDAHRPPHEPPAHIFTGPTGTNVNDLLIAWRVK